MKDTKRAKPFCFVTKGGSVISPDTLNKYVIKQGDGESKQIQTDSFADYYGQKGILQPIDNPSSMLHLLEMNTYHASCCKAKARDVAGQGYIILPVVDNPSDLEKELIEEFLAPSGTEEPNHLIDTLYQYRYDIEAIGYGAMEVLREGGLADSAPQDILHMPAHTVRRHQDGNRFLQIRGAKEVWFKRYGYGKDVHYKSGKEYPLGSLTVKNRATEVIWDVNYSPKSSYYGSSDIAPAIGTLSSDYSRREYNRVFFENYGIPAYAVWVTGNFDPGDVDENGHSDIQKQIQTAMKELPKNPHSTLVMTLPSIDGEKSDIEVQFEKLGTEVKEASFRLFRIDNRNEIIAAHGVPPYRVGVYETGALGGNLGESATEIYKRSIVEPRQSKLESILNHLILADGFGFQDWRIELTELDTKDEAHDKDILSTLFDKGAITPNELRMHYAEKFGFERSEEPAMNYHYINGIPIDSPDQGGIVLNHIGNSLNSLRDRVEKALEGGANEINT